MKLIVRNTKKSGQVRVFTFKKGKKYISVCLELDIVKEGSDPEELSREMMESVSGHIETVCKANLDDALLNRPAPDVYWKTYSKFLDDQKKSEVKRKADYSSLSIFPIVDLCPA
ncbi:MAG: hypothetical protein AAB413_05100 [Patescibacteria group bacterium]